MGQPRLICVDETNKNVPFFVCLRLVDRVKIKTLSYLEYVNPSKELNHLFSKIVS